MVEQDPNSDQPLEAALTATLEIEAEYWRTEILEVLVPYLPADLQKKAFDIAPEIKGKGRTCQLPRIRLFLSKSEKTKRPESQVFSQANLQELDRALNIENEPERLIALQKLAPQLPEALLTKAIVAVQKFKSQERQDIALTALAIRLAQVGQFNEALNLAQSITSENQQVEAWAGVLPSLPQSLQQDVFTKALDTARNIRDDLCYAIASVALVPWLVKFGRVDEALAIVQGIKYQHWREKALPIVILELAELERLEDALAAALHEHGNLREETLKLLVSKFAEAGQIEKALAIALGIKSEYQREEALAALSFWLAIWLAELSPTTRHRLWQEIICELEKVSIVETEESFEQSKAAEQLLMEIRTLMPVLETLGGPVTVGEAVRLVAFRLRQAAPPRVYSIELSGVFEAQGVLVGDDARANSFSIPTSSPDLLPASLHEPETTLAKRLIRYPNVECPDHSIINQNFSLFVQLLIKPSEPGVEAIKVEDTGILEQLPEVEVVLRVHGFDIEGSNTKVLQVQRDNDSEERFSLIPRCLGEQQIRVDFYQHGRRIGTSRHNMVVMEKPENRNVRQLKEPVILELHTTPIISPPDLELCVELDRHDGRTLYFGLHSTKSKVGYHHANFGQITLQDSPLEKMQAVYQELSRMAAPIKPTEQTLAERRLTVLGNDLWNELIPDKLKQEYWRFKSHVKTILITSDEPWVPWEAIKPYRYNDDGEREDDPFWCQRFALSRWLSGPGTANELLVGSARPIAPVQINLISVQEEVAFVKQLSSLRKGITSLEPFSACLEVLDCLEAGEFSVLHFACHGIFDVTLPDNSAIKLSDGLLRPSDIRARFGGCRLRPLIFINACHGARSEFSFTGLGGWAERLVEARVGAFVGAMWEVDDGLALRFAQRFYIGLLQDNETTAEAFRQAREEVRKLAPYNSTWLAYALYADPEGRIQDAKAVVN